MVAGRGYVALAAFYFGRSRPWPTAAGCALFALFDALQIRFQQDGLSSQLVGMLRSAGAAEVHLRISSPPVTGPCHYGVDLDSSGRLLGAEHTLEQIRAHLGATSLAYLSAAALAASTRRPGTSLCRACFDGDYPLAGSATKDALANGAPTP